MGRQGYLSGFSWHNEYHSELKKNKAANCIFLDEKRNCNNKKSPYYLSKCFVASNCPLKEKDETVESNKKIKN